MKFKKPNFQRLRREEVYQYIKEFLGKAITYNVGNIFCGEDQRLIVLHKELDKAIDVTRKSPFTAKIAEKDELRDKKLLGVKYMLKGISNFHLGDAKSEAAEILLVRFDHYKPEDKGYAQETGAADNLVNNIRDEYSAEVSLLGLEAEFNSLKEINDEVASLLIARDKERSLKPERNIAAICKEIDDCYGNMIRCLEVATIRPVDNNITLFANDLTKQIDRYRNVLAMRKAVNNTATPASTTLSNQKLNDSDIQTTEIPAKK
jgi:hypothetical protein